METVNVSIFLSFFYFTSFHATGNARAAAINLMKSPIKNGISPRATALLKLPRTIASHVTPQVYMMAVPTKKGMKDVRTLRSNPRSASKPTTYAAITESDEVSKRRTRKVSHSRSSACEDGQSKCAKGNIKSNRSRTPFGSK